MIWRLRFETTFELASIPLSETGFGNRTENPEFFRMPAFCLFRGVLGGTARNAVRVDTRGYTELLLIDVNTVATEPGRLAQFSQEQENPRTWINAAPGQLHFAHNLNETALIF